MIIHVELLRFPTNRANSVTWDKGIPSHEPSLCFQRVYVWRPSLMCQRNSGAFLSLHAISA